MTQTTQIQDLIKLLKQAEEMGIDLQTLLTLAQTNNPTQVAATPAQPMTEEEKDKQRYEHMTNEELINEYMNYMVIKKRRDESTINSYTKNLHEFLDWVEEHIGDKHLLKITYSEAEDYIHYLRTDARTIFDTKLAPAYINQKHSTLGSFYKYFDKRCHVLNTHLPHEERNFFNNIEQLPVYDLTIRHEFLTVEETNLLLDTIWKQTARRSAYVVARNHLLFRLIVKTGLRIHEALKFKYSDINFVKGEAVVLGKRNKKRIVLITDDLVEEIHEFMKMRNQVETEHDFLFLSEGTKKGKPHPLDRKDVCDALKSYVKAAGINPTGERKITNHTLRHTFVTHQAQNGADARDVSKWAGHSDVQFTIDHYYHVGKTEKDEEISRSLGY